MEINKKIEDANGVIKRHTEQILELEPEINDMKYDMSQITNFKKDLQEDLDNVKETSKAKDETHEHQIDLLKNQLNDLQVKDEDFNDRINNNLEKIVRLEENSVMQEQKARYVEALNERVQAMDEAKQQSEAKTKEEDEEKLKTNQELLDSLKKDIENNLQKLNENNEARVQDISDLNQKNKKFDEDSQEIKLRLAELGHEKEKLVDEVDHVTNKSKILADKLEDKIEELDTTTKQLHDDLDKISKENDSKLDVLEEDVKQINEKLKESVRDEIKELSEQVREKLDDIENESQINAGHVENLRELNNKLLERIKTDVQDDIDKNKDNIEQGNEAIKDLQVKLDELKTNFNDVKEKDIEHLVEAKSQMEDKIKNLEDESKNLDEQIKTEQEHFITIIRDKETNEKMLKELNEKIVVVEKAQDDMDVQMIKETIDSLEDRYAKAEEDRKGLSDEVKIVETRRDADTVMSQQKMQKIETLLDANYEDMWNVVLPMYGALRGYTVILYSEGMARDHQTQCMGVYRSTGYHNGRPVYKQDEGENYLFYHNHCWLIGPQVGKDYAWIRNPLEDQRTKKSSSPSHSTSSSSDPSSSSEDSDTGSDGLGVGKGVKRFTKTRTNLGLKVRTPDQLTRGWQYRLLISVDQSAWMEDDSSLRVEALKDVDRVGKIIRRLKTASREID